jgi:hypothetical protein
VSTFSGQNQSILRITPALLGLFSLVTLLADVHARRKELCIQRTAWYDKKRPTFSDALATVRQEFWANVFFRTSQLPGKMQNWPFLPSNPSILALFEPING